MFIAISENIRYFVLEKKSMKSINLSSMRFFVLKTVKTVVCRL